MPDISTFIKKSDYDTEIREIENKYVNNTGFNSKLAQAYVITKRNLMQKLMRLKRILKNYKYFIRAILLVKIIFEKMVHKIS